MHNLTFSFGIISMDKNQDLRLRWQRIKIKEGGLSNTYFNGQEAVKIGTSKTIRKRMVVIKDHY
jgi:hypothetical protein